MGGFDIYQKGARGILLLAVLLAGLAGCAGGRPSSPQATLTPFQPVTYTPTPFQPAVASTPAPSKPAAAGRSTSPAPPRDFYGIDLSGDERVVIQITPRNASFNRGRAIQIAFIPAKACVFGDKRGCVFAYRAPSGAAIYFVSVHSGVGGEGQTLRHALEGTGINQAGLSLRQIETNLRNLEGAAVRITQGSRVVEGLSLTQAGRVKAAQMERYFDAPLERALSTAAGIDPSLVPAVNPSSAQLVIETCGWKSTEEPWAAGVTSTTASVYLGVIRKAP